MAFFLQFIKSSFVSSQRILLRIVRNVRVLAQAQPVHKWQSWSLNPALFDTEASSVRAPLGQGAGLVGEDRGCVMLVSGDCVDSWMCHIILSQCGPSLLASHSWSGHL